MKNSEQTRRELLVDLTTATSYAVGAHAQCITGVAILVELARLQGIELTPRAVSVAGEASLVRFVTGIAATEFFEFQDSQREREAAVSVKEASTVEDAFRYSGHLVAIDEHSSMLLDPSFEQFGKAGFPNVVIAAHFNPDLAEFKLSVSEDAFVVYLLDANICGWRENYELARAAVMPMVLEVAAHLSSGGRPHNHNVRLDLDGSILT